MRYLPGTYQDIEKMLKTIGVPSLESLFEPIPKEFRHQKPLDLPKTLSEMELRELISEISSQNQAQSFTQFLGGGCYAHFVPTIVNYLSSQGGFLTSYTPYQPEISQGTLRTIFEFQTMIARLTGMEVANASMYDGATALAEACLMAKRLFPEKREILLSRGIHPEYRDVCKTYTNAQDIQLRSINFDSKSGGIEIEDLKAKTTDQTLAIVVQNPNFFGTIENLSQIQTTCRSKNILFIVCVTEPLSLAILKSPGEFGADIVVGETQSFGNAPSYGGPHVGFFATRMSFVRSIPGRVVGETVDDKGNRAFTLTLSTREQHIRREKATSNICTNQALLATRATIYMATLGEQGLRKLARWNHSLACQLREALKGKANLRFHGPFFNEITVEFKKPIDAIVKKCLDNKIVPGIRLGKFYPELENCLLICTTELTSKNDIERLVNLL